MIDLYLLCADLKDEHSQFKQESSHIISEIYSCLRHPSEKTRDMTAGWKGDFQYIYGDITTNLSSNSKLNKTKLLTRYGVECGSNGDEVEALQLLFFSIQTYLSLLTKYIMKDVLAGLHPCGSVSYQEIILGDFARRYGITNYCRLDWYCWPLYELDNGFQNIMEGIRRHVESYRSSIALSDVPRNGGGDLIKQIYESMIPKELRHALGEYYTPDWLAESTLNSAIGMSDPQDVRTLSIIDPTCGSGTFLLKAISLKRRHNGSLSDLLATVKGIDINPLAVLSAKTNYLLSVLDLLDGTSRITIPVFHADLLKIPTPAEDGIPAGRSDAPSEAVKSGMLQDGIAVRSLEKADLIIGNPPWVNWEYMPEPYRQSSQQVWADYNLFSAKGRELSFSKEDISVLITYIAIDKLLRRGGVIGFVIRQGVFKSAQNGVGFRRFQVLDDEIRVVKVEDLSKIKAFETAANHAALFFARKGEKTEYPVPYYLWRTRNGLRKYSAYSPLQEVMRQITVVEQCAIPAVKDDLTSIWITADKDHLRSMEKVLGTNRYKARTGVFTGGANAVYWLKIHHAADDCVSITNIVDRAKRKSEQITAEIEKKYVFPMLKGGNVSRWNITYDAYLLCPHTAETKIRPVPQEELAAEAPKTLEYLQHFRKDLDGRNGFAGWEKEIQRSEFHSVLRVGAYTFSEYKVVWKYIASEFICAVAGSVDDPFLGVKTILPNEKIMYVSTDDEGEAYFLCGVLSSTLVSECVKSYMNPTSISAHVLNKLNIPDYDETNPIHRKIAGLCKAGHGKTSLSRYIRGIDRLIAQLYGA